MKTTDSQLNYLSKRGKSYNQKYGILSEIIQYLPKDKKVIELFGGVGITSYFIQKYLSPTQLVINELDDRCIEILKKFNNVTVKKEDSFYSDIKEYDIVFVDSNFTKKMFKKFDGIFRGIKDTLILTETGIFNLVFNKKLSQEEYFKDYEKLFSKYGLYLHKVYYTHSFSIMEIQKTFSLGPIIYKHTNEDTEWKEYIKCINTH